MTDTSPRPGHRLRPGELATRRETPFRVEPDAAARAAMADELDVLNLAKLRLEGSLGPSGRRDWLLRAQLGATVTQACVVTLAPVTTRIDVPVRRLYLAQMEDPGSGEVEMPEDDTREPLPEEIDLEALMLEALALAIPPYPRAEGAALDQAIFAPRGAEPLTDEAMRPFAGLAGLKKKLDE
ncbi:hypothetical protein DDZ14_02020 [Maritimibacter sp. 55A14]|uniref:YceD family protein n=1 Tax=Maritimibacter sp. 55A14 TaxID=2174844 RepID=UPI000D60E191|nr:YceD family protein [Maritimibacter sp. 55A14]PWE33963.1 hypothetical protein DDZ14_02020 [Maritimibacter sp. 55A14]